MDYIWKDGKLIPKQEYLDRDMPKFIALPELFPSPLQRREDYINTFVENFRTIREYGLPLHLLGFKIVIDPSISPDNIEIRD